MENRKLDGIEVDLVESVANAIKLRAPLPAIDIELDLDQAYRLQHEVTSALCADAGRAIKAGVTNPQIQAFFGLDHALIGSLYSASRLAGGAVIPFQENRILELELAVKLDANGKPVAIAPAIEAVCLQFGRPEDMSAPNLVLCNLGTEAYLLGEFTAWQPPYDGAAATLYRDSEAVGSAVMSDAMGGPELAAPWMWQESAKRSFTAGAETIFLTGACGTTVPAEEGRYMADYGPLGSLEFTISHA